MSLNAILAMSYFAPVLYALLLRTRLSHTYPNVMKISVAHAFPQEPVLFFLECRCFSAANVSSAGHELEGRRSPSEPGCRR